MNPILHFGNPVEAYKAGYALMHSASPEEFRHIVGNVGTVYTVNSVPMVDIVWFGGGKAVGSPIAEVKAAATATRPL